MPRNPHRLSISPLPALLLLLYVLLAGCTPEPSSDAKLQDGQETMEVADPSDKESPDVEDVPETELHSDASDVDATDSDVSDTGADADLVFDATLRVLFVGNSYTYTNDLPAVVTELAAASGVLLEVEVIAPGGAKFCDHSRSQETMARIGSGDHDLVVIHGQSVDMFYDGETAAYCADDLGRQASDAGVPVLWFATWARREGNEFYSRGRGVTTPEEMTDFVEAVYRNISQWNPGGRVARVGHGWERALAVLDDIELHAADGSHPAPPGTFTAACTLTQMILGESPELPSPVPFGLDESVASILCDEATREPCFDDLQFCSGECVDLTFNSQHCGECELVCSPDKACRRSTCECTPIYKKQVTLGALTQLDSACDSAAARPAQACQVAAHLTCEGESCSGSGFGPFEDDEGDLRVNCVPADVVSTTYLELAAQHPDCDGVSERHGDACRTAAHRACVAQGAKAGFGPVSRLPGEDVEIACLQNAEVRLMPDVAIEAWGCDGFPDRVWDQACDEAVNGLCQGMGGEGGYGPIGDAPDPSGMVELVCIFR